jgi:hypothetical protein
MSGSWAVSVDLVWVERVEEERGQSHRGDEVPELGETRRPPAS